MERLGIFGGMFDPVHSGHISAAIHARDALSLDCLKLVPCASPNHRAPATANADHRLNMLELAVADLPDIEVDSIEIKRRGISYSVETLEAMREEGTGQQLVFVLGLDSFCTITSWHRWQRIFELCHLYVLGRPRAASSSMPGTEIGLDSRQVNNAQELFADGSGNVWIDASFRHLESSSRVRRKLRNHEDVSSLLDPKVLLYIHDNRLYR